MSCFSVKAEKAAGRTVVRDIAFTSPLKAAKPFYREDHTEVMMMAASAGILDGDRREITVEAATGAALKFTEQSYTKVFRAADRGAEQSVLINVQDGAAVYFAAQPIIPFAGSRFRSSTEVRLTKSARFACSEVISCGRAAMGERFRFDSIISRTAVYVGGRLRMLDLTRLIPEESGLSGIGFFEGKTHIGMLYCFNYTPTPAPDEHMAISRAAEGLIIRAVSDSADELSRRFEELMSGFFTK